MYNPPHFHEDRLEILQELIREHSLATLVTLGADGLIANHVPLILDPEPLPHGILRGHLARANSQWHESLSNVEALAIFQGPSAYITPSWYPTKQETGRVVPTYNYAVVHVRGPLRTFDHPHLLEQHLRALTAFHEQPFDPQWTLDQTPPGYVEGLIKGIIGIEIPISLIEGKWKVSQNRNATDRQGVIDGLRETGAPDALRIANLVRRKAKIAAPGKDSNRP